MNTADRLWTMTPASHAAHPLHAQTRDFPETNCYVDVWIEILHALDLDPHACLGVTVATDFEGDQWTFFKPTPGDLDRLYGIRVEELTLWRSLLDHACVQTGRERLPLVEVDAYFLPDTSGTDYRRQHVKTTVGIAHANAAGKRLRYFHNAGFFELEGEDFDGVFGLTDARDERWLPPYAELAKFDHLRMHDAARLRELAMDLLRHHFARRPAVNPFVAYAREIGRDVEMLLAGDLALYHAYGFASVRQFGASFALLVDHLLWLDEGRKGPWSVAAQAFAGIAPAAKTLILNMARIANSKRTRDLSSPLLELGKAWEQGMERISGQLGV